MKTQSTEEERKAEQETKNKRRFAAYVMKKYKRDEQSLESINVFAI